MPKKNKRWFSPSPEAIESKLKKIQQEEEEEEEEGYWFSPSPKDEDKKKEESEEDEGKYWFSPSPETERVKKLREMRGEIKYVVNPLKWPRILPPPREKEKKKHKILEEYWFSPSQSPGSRKLERELIDIMKEHKKDFPDKYF